MGYNAYAMNSRPFVWMGMFLGSLVGGYLPTLWGADVFSMSSIILSTVGALAGIYVGFKISQNL